jgi:transcription elongation factor GreA
MPASELLEIAEVCGYEDFEAQCLELLEKGQLALPQLVAPFEHFERNGTAGRLATFTLMVLDSLPSAVDPPAALALVRIALIGSPANEDLRQIMVDLYRKLYGQTPGFDVILAASGLAAGRPVRNALKVLDLCLGLTPGDTLLSLMDDRVAEVDGIDPQKGLFTLRRESRLTTIPAAEMAREYERIAPDDFRALRLHPEKLAKRIEDDPVTVVIGLIHTRGKQIDADVLKHELVPRYIAPKEWSRWWTRARGLLKRSPHVLIEGRSPMILKYHAAGKTLEQETWDALHAQSEPTDWMATFEGYLREKATRKEPPDEALLRRFHDHLVSTAAAVRSRRPAEALTCGLIILRLLRKKGLPATDESRTLAETLLRDAPDPSLWLRDIEHEDLRERGLDVLRTARPDDWVQYAVTWLRTAPAGLLDKLATVLADAGQAEAVQSFIDYGLSDPVRHPELLYWLWKGVTRKEALRSPPDDELFHTILETLNALGHTIVAEPEVIKAFRQRMRAALASRDYARVRQCLQQTSEAAAIPLRRQLERIEGLGENVPAKLLELLHDVHPHLFVVQREEIAPWQDRETIWCTSAGLAHRTAERDEIVNVKMPENARRIGEAARHGDLSENSEYKFALEERDLLRARVARINEELSRSRTLSVHDVPADYVGIGSRVTLRCTRDRAERIMTFLGPFETDVEQGIYSYLAPFSQRVMGLRAGDRVTVPVDEVETEYEIAAIANALETL